jgi:hypothetical protein
MKNIENDLTDINLDNYRVFSQLKRIVDRGKQPVDQEDTTETLNF